jgi:Zn-finger domain-containing protein
MANFNLNDYETVEERLARFLKDHPDGRIITENLTTAADRSVNMWVVKTTIYLTDADQERQLPKATGHAFEIDGVNGMANKTSALENCETSSIGRALANAGYSGNKRATREEMAKVERAVTPRPARDWEALLEGVTTKAEARALYDQARTSNAGQQVLAAIKTKGESLA